MVINVDLIINFEVCVKVHYVGNKAKERISKRVFQENKARQIFRKNEHFLPPDTHRFEIRPSALLPATVGFVKY